LSGEHDEVHGCDAAREAAEVDRQVPGSGAQRRDDELALPQRQGGRATVGSVNLAALGGAGGCSDRVRESRHGLSIDL
jgi:hypothetical protein